ncbi:non-ribosomal peptide synthetase [Acanthopleuribacter pedis]|uniref:Amino acid adenylation domain-containing protein n=1 Tax=Acanthopleuribacter pedis TaxID=442870 RepID=A0A8J7QEE7_9BACT|nr:non-ribosomal peptide synthetase [Acanthopleuribacter pedis]MBO1317498.1 amino acid adenylation domain-containing protein [Acanthopleuribacter pedis]
MAHNDLKQHANLRTWTDELADTPIPAGRPKRQAATRTAPVDLQEKLHRLARGNPTAKHLMLTAVWQHCLQRHGFPAGFHLAVAARALLAEAPPHQTVFLADQEAAPFKTLLGQVKAALEKGLAFRDTAPHALARALGDDAAVAAVLDVADSRVAEHLPAVVSVRFRDDPLRLEVVMHRALGYSAASLADAMVTLLAHVFEAPHADLSHHALLDAAGLARLRQLSSGPKPPEPAADTLFSVFARLAAKHPDHTALVHNTTSFSYRDLATRATQTAAALNHQHGVGAGDQVAVLLPRGAEAVIAMLALFRLGAVYVPVDTGYPAGRRALILQEARPRLVIHGALTPPEGLPALAWTDLAHDTDQQHAEPPPGPVGDDPAYLLFTSGSSGRPKGVLVRHRGFCNTINHQIQTVAVTRADRCLAFAPLGFDASPAEIFLALHAGAACYLIDDAVKLDTHAFQRFLHDHGITVATLPPAFQAALPVEALTGLRALISAGEAPRPAQVAALAESVAYFNAYGPTEASVCCAMGRLSAADADTTPIPMGRPLQHTRVLVLDRCGRLLPPGAVGELAIAGPGLAVGYFNRDDLTAAAFVVQPETGERVYLSGDLGRYRADGRLEYHGRRDRQLKLRGNRIESGELEQALRDAGCRDARVLCADGQVWAFALGDGNETQTRAALTETVPEYALPQRILFLERWPTTAHGKIDEGRLLRQAQTRRRERIAPEGANEQLLVALWTEVLGKAPQGVGEPFFHAGGDSIAALQMTARLAERGLRLTVRDFYEAPTIRGLAQRMQQAHAAGTARQTGDIIPMTPIQKWFFQSGREPLHHFNQAVCIAPAEPLDLPALQTTLDHLWRRHPQLQVRFQGTPIQQVAGDPETAPRLEPIKVADVSQLSESEARALQNQFDLEQGPLIRWIHLSDGADERLVLCAHHLVIDGVSWRILLGDLAAGYVSACAGSPPPETPPAEDFGTWAAWLEHNPPAAKEQNWWKAQLNQTFTDLPADEPARADQTRVHGHVFDRETTAALTGPIHAAYGTDLNDHLLAAFTAALQQLTGGDRFKIAVEGHGRDETGRFDLSRTLGWFTSLFPVVLSAAGSAAQRLIGVKETLRAVPNKGLDYGQLLYGEDTGFADPKPAQISFNFLGSFDNSDDAGLRLVRQNLGPLSAPNAVRPQRLELIGWIHAGRLHLELTRHRGDFSTGAMTAALQTLVGTLQAQTDHCSNQTPQRTPSDFTYATLSRTALQQIEQEPPLDDIQPLTPMQQGVYFQNRWADDATYFEQTAYLIEGPLNLDALQQALVQLGRRHPVTRTLFRETEQGEAVALISGAGGPEFRHLRLESEQALDAALQADRADSFNLEEGPLVRLTLLTLGPKRAWLVWSFHHILMDGWCLGIISHDFFQLLHAAQTGGSADLPAPADPRAWFQWLDRRDAAVAKDYWRAVLAEFAAPTSPVTRPALETPYQWQRHTRRLGQDRTKGLQDLAGAHGLSVFNLVQALWSLWLAKHGDVDDVVFGTVVSGRPAEVRDIERMIGLFMNTVPVRHHWREDERLLDAAHTLAERLNDAAPHHHLPLHEILAQSPLGNRLFDHILIFENYPVSRQLNALLGQLKLKLADWRSFEQTPYPFNLSFHPGEDMELVFECDTGRFNEDDVDAVTGQWCFLIDQWRANPNIRRDQIALTREPRTLRGEPAPTGPALTVADLFAAKVAAAPNHPALIDGAKQRDYAWLNREVQHLAKRLVAAGVAPGDRVAVCLGRSERMPLALLAVAAAAAVFVPLDAGAPAQRLAFIAEDCGARLALVENGVTAHFPCPTLNLDQNAAVPAVNLPPQPEPREPAYLVYTSGSTGQPKGVVVSHAALFNQVQAWVAGYGLANAKPIALQVAGFAFDVFVGDVARTLLVGGTLVICNEQVRLDPPALFDLLDQHRVTLFEGTPGLVMPLLRWMAAEQRHLPAFRLLIVGSDAWTTADARFARRVLPDTCRLVNSYGVTEATIDSCYFEIREEGDLPASGPVPIGRPLAGNQLSILDRHGLPLPAGAVGELFIGGPAVAEGYWQRPELTQNRFRTLPGLGRVYASGDRVRCNERGDLVFLGRGDSQVKVRGYRIEPGEVENALGRCDGVASAVVIARKDASDNATLIAYLLGDGDEPAVRAQVGTLLPAYMMPAAMVFLDQMPLTRNGKVDRRALAARDDRPAPTLGRAPRNPREQSLWRIFAALLGLSEDSADIDRDFFAAGGHSLLVLRLLGRIRKELGLILKPQDVFAHPTVAGLAKCVAERQTLEPITPQPQADHYPLSFSQRRLWILHQMDAAEAYNVPGAFTLDGPLRVDFLEQAVAQLTERHESLRTHFTRIGDEPRQVVAPVRPFSLKIVDLSDQTEPESAVSRLAHTEANQAFDLEKGPLFRVTLVRLEPQRHVLLFTLHHIIADGWSMDNLFREIGLRYQALIAGKTNPLPPLPFQYRDYAVWSRNRLEGEEGARLHQYWHGVFAEQPPALRLPTDRPRPPLKTYRGGSVVVPLPDALMPAFTAFCQNRELTPFMGLLAALNILLYRLTGQTDLVVSSPAAGRPHPDLDDHVGLFINSVALRTRFSDATSFDALLDSVRAAVIGALAHGLYPFDRLVGELPYGHDPSRSPLADVMLSYVSQPHRQAETLGDLRIGTLESRFDTAKLDLSFDFLQAPDGWVFSVEYNSDLFHREAAAQFGTRLLTVMDHLSRHPAPDHRTLPLVPASALSLLQGPPVAQVETDVVAAIQAAANRFPDRIAVRHGEARQTFAQLTDLAARLARVIRDQPRFQPGKPVAVLQQRDVHYPAVVLALLAAGAVYVPVDPDYPANRIQTMLRESGARHVIAAEEHRDMVQAPGRRLLTFSEWVSAAASAQPTLNQSLTGDRHAYLLDQPLTGDRHAYLMFTSGSSGVPKAVAVSHANLAHTVLHACAGFTIGDAPDACFALVAGFAFDIALLELLLPLSQGAAVSVLGRDLLLDAEQRHGALQQVTAFHAVPALLQHILDYATDFPRLRWLFTGGDRVPAELLQRAAEVLPEVRLFEWYGPTETTVICSALDVGAEGDAAFKPGCIGRPLPGVTLSLRDRNDQIVPRGCLGELHITGPGVAAGYRTKGRLDRTPFHHDGETRYRTGDWATCTNDGLLLFAGRADEQLKIRGIRMEPAEVEQRLRAHPAVEAALVAGREEKGQTHLAAYCVADTDVATLRAHLAQSLAEPMIPTRWFFLDALPRDPHGKIDRKALAALKTTEPETRGTHQAPRNETERALCAIWAEVLQRDVIGIDQHFTEVGGHSLELTQIALRIQQQFGFKPSIRLLISHPTVESLAVEIARHAKSTQRARTPVRAENTERFPATPDQQRLWVLCQFAEASRAYHLPGAFRFHGSVDQAAFDKAFAALVHRHPMLRARFIEEDKTLMVDLSGNPTCLSRLDLRNRENGEDDLAQFLAEESQRAFDLGNGPLFRCTLIQMDEETQVLALNLHHLIADGWSLNLLVADWWALYQHALGHGAKPTPPAYHFADYAADTAAHRQQRFEADRAWWRQRFATPPAPLEWVTDRPRPAVKRYRGAQPRFPFPHKLWNRVTTVAAQLGVTPFTVLTAAVFGWAQRRTGQNDVCFGTPVSGRDHQAWEPLVGLFLNTTVLRTEVRSEASFAALVGQVEGAINDAREHNAVGFAELVEAVNPPRDPGRAPLFDVFVSMFSRESTLPDGWTYETADYPTGQFDLSFQFGSENGAWQLYLEYDSDVYDASTAAHFADHWFTLLDAWTADAAAPLQRAAALETPATAEGPKSEYTKTSLLSLFKDQVLKQPDKTAYRCGETLLSYRAWWDQVEHLAGALAAMPKQPALVAVAMPRDLNLAVALAAIWRSGAAWLPLDPALPAARRDLLLADSDADLVLCTPETRPSQAPCPIRDFAETLAAGTPIAGPLPQNPASRAYLLYTSGSTGHPKGVSVAHGALLNFLRAMAERPGLETHDRVAAVTPMSFDISLLEWWLAPLVGATVDIFTREQVLDDPAVLQQRGVTLLQTTPANLALLHQAGWQPDPELRVLCGGEALPLPLAQKVAAQVAALWNMYGPTETTIWSTCARITPHEARIHCGTPIHNTRIVILDEQERACPPGVRGEIAIAGAGLADGYHDRETLTQTAFAPARGIEDSPRFYRTGDLGYLDQAGRLVVLGRRDFQIKHKGHRIEPGEIEAALCGAPEVNQAAVLLQGQAPETLLVAYVTANPATTAVDFEAVVQRLHVTLPAALVPQRVVQVQAMPLNSSGKIDRAALAAQTPAQQTAPATLSADQEQLAALWRSVGVTADAGPNSHFFAAGGNSLSAVRLRNRVRESLGLEINLTDVFRAPTLAAQCQLLLQAPPAETATPRAPDAARYAASPNQTALWQHAAQLGSDQAYLLPGAFRIKGAVAPRRLRAALEQVVAAQESLRYQFEEEDGSLWFRVKDAVSIPWQEIDLRGTVDAEAQAQTWLEREATTPMAVETALTPRVRLLQLADEDHLLLVTLHHLVSDAWSLDLLLQHWLRAYQGVAPTPPATRYRDIAHQANATDHTAARAWWRDQLADPPEPLDLAVDRETGHQTSAASRFHDIEPALVQRLNEVARDHEAGLFHLLVAATACFLHRYSGQEDLLIGTAAAGRDRREWEDVIGLFVQSPTLRLHPRGDLDFAAHLHQVRDHVVQATQFAAAHRPTRQPRVMLVMQEAERGAPDLPEGLSLTRTETAAGPAMFDLTIHISPHNKGLRLSFTYATALFDADTIAERVARFVDLLPQIAADPSRPLHAYRMLSPQRLHREQQRLQQSATLPQPTMHLSARLAETALRYADRTALVDGERRLTYADIDQLSARIATYLVAQHGIQPGQRVGLCLQRSAEMVVALLGILRAGAAYVPLDPDYPRARLDFFAEDAGLVACLSDARSDQAPTKVTPIHYQDAVAHHPLGSPPPRPADAETYVIYTSGSTGRPKGVPMRDNRVAALFEHAAPRFQFDEQDVWTLFHSVAFDFSVWELFGALLHGGTLVIVPQAVARDSRRFAQLLQAEQVTILNQIPSAFAALTADLEATGLRLPDLRQVIFGGEALNPAALASFAYRHPHCALINMYGITETCVHVTFRKLDPAALKSGASDIGTALPHLHISLLGKYGEWVPDGAAGEICVTGLGLAEGYHQRPELSAERFPRHPHLDGLTMYRSGDQARRDRCGNLMYQGRADQQVKVRGHRIEVGEVEAVLFNQTGVTEAVVRAVRDAAGQGTLLCWFTGTAEPAALRATARTQLPAYMRPAAFLPVDGFPRTPSGKIDVAALPRIVNQGKAPLATETEQALGRLWRELLHLPCAPDADSDFFELGGHSLNALRLCRRIEQQLGRTATPRLLFENPKLRDLAAALDQTACPAEQAWPIPPLPATATPLPSPQQQALWLLAQTRDLADSYHVCAGFRVQGPLAPGRIAAALQDLTAQHESLRTAFDVVAGQPRLRIADEVALPLRVVDAADWHEADQHRRQREPFDIATAPLLRAWVVRESPNQMQIWLCAHHLIIDGWSMELLQQQFLAALSGKPNPAPSGPRYRDVAHWLQGQAAEHLGYWRDQLAEPAPPVHLPQDGSRADAVDFAAAHVTATLPAEVVTALQQQARRLHISDFSLQLSLLFLTLAKLSGQNHLCIGTPVAGRPRLDLEPVVGYLVNTLPLTARLTPDRDLESWLQQVHRAVLGALDHQLVTFDQLVKAHQPEVTPGRHPFFDVMLVFQNQPAARPADSDLIAEPLPAPSATAKFDLTWTIMPGAESWLVDLAFRTALFSRERAAFFLKTYRDMVTALCAADPGPLAALIGAPAEDDELCFELEF